MPTATAKVFAFLTVFVALSIVTSTNAALYSYITHDLEVRVCELAGYDPADYVENWKAEGNAIYRALQCFYNIYNIFRQEGIEVIVGSTGSKTCSYIYGEAERLEAKLSRNEKPLKIIVIYTLNYVNFSAKEYLDFKGALQRLIDAGEKHVPKIKVEVKQFRPVFAKGKSELVDKIDYQNHAMDSDQEEAQYKQIEDVNNAVNDDTVIGTKEYERFINDVKVGLIVDGILEVGGNPVDGTNHLLSAIPRAQIRIMAKAILRHKRDNGVCVLCNDSPSGMDENGNWTIEDTLKYPVDCIFSRVWNKSLVNSAHFVEQIFKTRVIVLDIMFKGTRLFQTLFGVISAAVGDYDPNLVLDVDKARLSTGLAIRFKEDGERMAA